MGGSLDGLDLGEGNADLAECSGVISEHLVGLDDAGLDDLDRLVGGSVSAAHLSVYRQHSQKSRLELKDMGPASLARARQREIAWILTHLRNSASEGGVSELLVHVDGFSSGQVSENDAVVLDDASLLFVDFLDGDDLTLDLSDLVLSLHVVPELGLGKDWVGGEHSHSVEGGVRLRLSGEASADDEELSDLQERA